MTEDTQDALAMLSPLVVIEPAGKKLVRDRQGNTKVVTTDAWIKFGVAFRNELYKLEGADANVFLCICLHVNGDGEAWPGLDTICRETNRARATVVKAIKHLKALGLLEVTRGRLSNTYRPLYASYGRSSNIELPEVQKLNFTSSIIEPEVEPRKKNQERVTREKPPRETPALFSLAQSIATVCGMDFNANRGRLFREAKELSTAQPAPTPELVKQHYNGNPAAFWKRDDWRGQKGQLPTPGAIRETWGKWAAKPAPKSTNGWNLKAAK